MPKHPLSLQGSHEPPLPVSYMSQCANCGQMVGYAECTGYLHMLDRSATHGITPRLRSQRLFAVGQVVRGTALPQLRGGALGRDIALRFGHHLEAGKVSHTRGRI